MKQPKKRYNPIFAEPDINSKGRLDITTAEEDDELRKYYASLGYDVDNQRFLDETEVAQKER